MENKTKSVQIFQKGEDGSLMTYIKVPEYWTKQDIIIYIQEVTKNFEFNIMWIKVKGKKILYNGSHKEKNNE